MSYTLCRTLTCNRVFYTDISEYFSLTASLSEGGGVFTFQVNTLKLFNKDGVPVRNTC